MGNHPLGLLLDSLSRLPTGTDPMFENTQSLSPVVNLIQDEHLNCLPISAQDIAKATVEDKVLQQVMKLIQRGWPQTRRTLKPELHPYFDRRDQLTLHQDCILCGLRVVTPQSLRERVLEEVHAAHAGVVRMKSVARMHVWWPGIDKQIEKCARECQSCQENQRNPAKAPLHPWEAPQQPWKRLHIDFAGPFEGQMWLIVIDACSKWPEVIAMTSTTTEKTIAVLRSMFSRYGIPDQIVSDNGPQFTAEEFKQFCLSNGIRHTLTAPYHPSSNGEAERFVQTFKSTMRRGKGVLQSRLYQFLLHYRTTPHTVTGKTPAELMFGRRIKTRLDLLHPSGGTPLPQPQKETCKEPPRKARELEVGDAVWVRNYRGSPRWLPGLITIKMGPRNYKVRVDKQTQKRHIDQLRIRCMEPARDAPADKYLEYPTQGTWQSDEERETQATQAAPPRRYPPRENRRPPERLGY